jgi:hypothetical protein
MLLDLLFVGSLLNVTNFPKEIYQPVQNQEPTALCTPTPPSDSDSSDEREESSYVSIAT